MLAYATLPGQLAGEVICSAGTVTRANGRLANFVDSAPGGVLGDNSLQIDIGPAYTYALDFNGFGGPAFESASRVGGGAFEVFLSGGEELQIAKPLTRLEFTTYGLATYDAPCFFAVGAAQPPGQVPQGALRSYSVGFGDGLHRAGGGDLDRLYGTTASMELSASGAYSLVIDFASIEDPFAEPGGQAVRPLARVSVALTLDKASFKTAPIAGPNGMTGEIRGARVGASFGGAVFVFDLVNPAGERIWGVLALDGDAI